MAQVSLEVLDISDPLPQALEVTCVTSESLCPVSSVLPDFQDWAVTLAAV